MMTTTTMAPILMDHYPTLHSLAIVMNQFATFLILQNVMDIILIRNIGDTTWMSVIFLTCTLALARTMAKVAALLHSTRPSFSSTYLTLMKTAISLRMRCRSWWTIWVAMNKLIAMAKLTLSTIRLTSWTQAQFTHRSTWLMLVVLKCFIVPITPYMAHPTIMKEPLSTAWRYVIRKLQMVKCAKVSSSSNTTMATRFAASTQKAWTLQLQSGLDT